MRNESDIIERVWSRLPTQPRADSAGWLELGVGDDAAIVRPGHSAGRRGKAGSAGWVLSCDAFLEDVHFLTQVSPPEAIGYKALARATSDLAAMGAVPRFFMLSLALPAKRTGEWLDGMLSGMARAARQFGMALIGGDTSRSATVAIHLTVGGVAAAGRALTRAGARPGDDIYVSGRLGAAQLGLDMVLRGLHREQRWKRLLTPHLYPQIQIALGGWLGGENSDGRKSAGRPIASAAIDTSDGLSTDLAHICESSGVGARIWAEKIPAAHVPESLRNRGFDPLELALHGGEDYQLLFTVPTTAAHRLPRSYRGVPITRIGEIIPFDKRSHRHVPELRSGKRRSSARIELIDSAGRATSLIPSGWDHFRER